MKNGLIGICTTDFEDMLSHPLERKSYSADEVFERIAAYGYNCTQFSFTSISEAEFVPTGELELPPAIRDAALRAADKASAKYNVPIIAINGTFNMTHPDAEIRTEGIRRLGLLAEAANELGCGIITLCSGTRRRENLWAPHPDNHTDGAWTDMLDTMKRAAEIAERCGIRLAIETEASNVIDTPQRARAVMDEVGSDKLKMIIDCANLFHIGKAKRENVRSTMAEAFEFFGRDMIVAHGKDIRESDGIEFCPAGEGIVDYDYFAELLEKYEYSGAMVMHGIYDESKMPAAAELWKNIG